MNFNLFKLGQIYNSIYVIQNTIVLSSTIIIVSFQKMLEGSIDIFQVPFPLNMNKYAQISFLAVNSMFYVKLSPNGQPRLTVLVNIPHGLYSMF